MSGTSVRSEADGRAEAGFTIVEVLVALALFTLLSTLLFGNVRFGLAAWTIGGTRSEQADNVATAQGIVRRLLEEAYPLMSGTDPTSRYVAFEGMKQGVSFLASSPAVMGAGGRFRFAMTLDRRDAATDLIMSAQPELEGPGAGPGVARTVLLADVEGVEFSFFGPSDADRAPRWQDVWSRRSEPPKLVRMRATFRANDKRSWPELVVSPRVTVDVGCGFDPLTARCRGR